MFKVLVVDDDKILNKSICSYLSTNGYVTKGAVSASEAYDIMYKEPQDVIVSDVMMPGTDGFEFAESIRRLDAETPILFISARSDMGAKERGFRIGIDDYIVKPFDISELLYRIEALLRRAKIAQNRRITVGELELDVDKRSVRLGGMEIPFTVREFDILYKLLSHPRETFTRSQLMDEFWSRESDSSSRSVDVYMAKIRSKLSDCEDFEIVAVHGLGYKAVLK